MSKPMMQCPESEKRGRYLGLINAGFVLVWLLSIRYLDNSVASGIIGLVVAAALALHANYLTDANHPRRSLTGVRIAMYFAALFAAIVSALGLFGIIG